MNSPQELFEDFLKKAAAKPDLAASINGEVQYDFSPSDHGKWVVTFENGKIDIREGETENPLFTLIAKFDHFVDFYTGKLSAISAVMTGKIKIKGSMSEALKMQQFL